MAMSTYSSTLSNVTMMTTANITNEIDMDNKQGIAVVVINGFLSFIGTFGNFLIIFALLKTPHLRQRPSNYLILSLAVADLVVTMVAQPLYVTATALKTFERSCNISLEFIYRIASPFSCSSSAFHLAAISIDRVISTVKPHNHREIMTKWSKVMLSICWGTALLLGGLLIRFPAVNFVGVVLIMLCEVVMICSYGIIIYKVKSFRKSVETTLSPASTSTARERAMENRMSATIAIVILLFAACWFPLVGYSFSHPVESFYCAFDMKLNWITTLLLANSSMNFIVYSSRIRQFRSAYLKMISSMLHPFGQIVGKCICKRSMQQNTDNT